MVQIDAPLHAASAYVRSADVCLTAAFPVETLISSASESAVGLPAWLPACLPPDVTDGLQHLCFACDIHETSRWIGASVCPDAVGCIR